MFAREERELDLDGRHVWAILARSIKLDSVPERSGVVRVVDYDQTMAITSNGRGGTKGEKIISAGKKLTTDLVCIARMSQCGNLFQPLCGTMIIQAEVYQHGLLIMLQR